jgi:cobalt-zinc-cadmium efflux system outer membrane protein
MRFFPLLILCATTVANAQPALAPTTQTTLSEHDAVEAAIRRAPLGEVTAGTSDVERGRGLAARAYPNPELSYSREQTFGSSGTAENYLVVSQTLDIGNRRRLRGEAGDLRAEAARLDGGRTVLAAAAEARLRFYELLARQLRVAAFERWTAQVGEALSIVTRREKGGEAAGYDRKRLEREAALANARLATARAEAERARTQLRAVMGNGAVAVVAGTLLPVDGPPSIDELRARGAKRPELRALDRLVDATDLERKAAAKWWVPEPRLELGWKGISFEAGGRSDGFVAGVSLALPLWDRSRGATITALGEARAARGRHALLELDLAAQLDGLRAEAVQLRSIAIDFEKSTISADLLRMTSRGYEAGELTLLELLDAYRGAQEDEATAIDMELAARRARIELDRLTGAPLP